MKKVLLLTILLIGSIAQAQTLTPSISPYYPDIVSTGSYNSLQTQITYFDLNFVNMKIQDYMINEMKMNLSQDKYDLVEGKGKITYTFSDNGAINTSIKKMYFIYSVEPIDGEFVVKSCKIVGDVDRVFNFYMFFWSSPLNFNQIKTKGIVYNNFMQDKVSFYYNANKPYITITNGSINNFQEFSTKYLEKKQVYIKNAEAKNIASAEAAKINNEKQQQKELDKIKAINLEKEERALETKKIKSRRYDITQTEVKKKGNNFIFNDVSDDVKSKIIEELRNKDDGIYVLKISTTYELDQPVEVQIGAVSYRKSKFESTLSKYLQSKSPL